MCGRSREVAGRELSEPETPQVQRNGRRIAQRFVGRKVAFAEDTGFIQPPEVGQREST